MTPISTTTILRNNSINEGIKWDSETNKVGLEIAENSPIKIDENGAVTSNLILEVNNGEDGDGKTISLKYGENEEDIIGTASLDKLVNNDDLQSTVNDINDAIDAVKNKVYTVTRNTNETDSAAINRIVGENTVNCGDVVIIKTLIVDDDDNTKDKYTHTSFVYDTSESGSFKWKAMDGDYDADNVYFTEDIELAGSYTQVGNINLSDEIYHAKGKSLSTVLSDIFDKTFQPQLGTDNADIPKMTVTLTGSGTREAGTSFTPSYTVNYTQGKYIQPWNDTKIDDGTSISECSVKESTSDVSKSDTSGSFAQFTISDTTNYKVTASITYSDGDIAKDNKGKPSDPTIQRLSAEINNVNSGSVCGGRYTFYGYSMNAAPSSLTSEFIRGLINMNNKWQAGGTNKSFTPVQNTMIYIPDGTKCVIIAIPRAKVSGSNGTYTVAGNKDRITSFIDVNDSNSENNTALVHKSCEVNDASGNNPVTYDVYLLDRPNGLNKNSYKFTV